ncbi:MAG TPA: hypothetical protein VMU18_13545 [Rhodoblastus sp.]|nr:hypothetical protein [Rhodoblastus sp.]
MAERFFELGRRDALANGGQIRRPDHQGRRNLYVSEFMKDRLGDNHVVDQRRVPGDDLMAGPFVETREHLHTFLTFGLPLAAITIRLLVSAYLAG